MITNGTYKGYRKMFIQLEQAYQIIKKNPKATSYTLMRDMGLHFYRARNIISFYKNIGVIKNGKKL